MKHRLRGVRWLALVALVAGVVAVPSALADEPQGQAEPLGSGLWFVEMNGQPTAAGGTLSAVKAEKAAFRAEAKKAGVVVQGALCLRQALERPLDQDDAAELASSPSIAGVKAVYPVLTAAMPPTEAGQIPTSRPRWR